MKIPILIILLSITCSLFSCRSESDNKDIPKNEQNREISKKRDTKVEEYFLEDVERKYIVGDFDGDAMQDTIVQSIYSDIDKCELKIVPSVINNEWDEVVDWYYNNAANVILTINMPTSDTLNLGVGQGMYCLINIGDNNSYGRDEIALVVDYCDFSNLNSCKIYSLCDGKWKVLKQFSIWEGAFDYDSEPELDFSEIKYFLVKANGKWVFQDYRNGEIEEDIATLMPLLIEKCE
jgi:hypothetical protein